MKKIYRAEINGFNNTFSSLGKLKKWVKSLQNDNYVKTGDKVTIIPGNKIGLCESFNICDSVVKIVEGI